MLKKREHTSAGNDETHTVAVLYQLAEYGQIGRCIDSSDSEFRRFFFMIETSLNKWGYDYIKSQRDPDKQNKGYIIDLYLDFFQFFQ